MAWQDIILSVGSWIFILALLPAVFSKDKPPFSTGILTGGLLMVFAGTYFSLNLRMGAVSSALLGVTWLILAAQKIVEKDK